MGVSAQFTGNHVDPLRHAAAGYSGRFALTNQNPDHFVLPAPRSSKSENFRTSALISTPLPL
jgi:hypothetical protein